MIAEPPRIASRQARWYRPLDVRCDMVERSQLQQVGVMRVLNTVQQQIGAKHVLLCDTPADPRYAGFILASYFLGESSGLPVGSGLFAPPMEDVRAHFETEYGFDPNGWIELPPQPEGCRDDCIVAIAAE